MASFTVEKTKYLNGKINTHGSKNSALPIMAASILSDKKSLISSVPKISDTENMKQLLESLGFLCNFEKNILSVTPSKKISVKAKEDISGKLRGSFLVAGPLLASFGEAIIGYPGGCSIGSRPIDLHLKGFEALGAKTEIKQGYIRLCCDKLKGAPIYLDFPSVGATENLLMASVLAEGETVIENAAAEPEITDLADCLCEMGAEISGIGTDKLKIRGVKKLNGINHRIIPDRIEAGTFMAAITAVGGEAVISNVIPDHLKPITAKLRETGAEITEEENSIRISSSGNLKPSDIITLPHPGFPTDMQASYSVILSRAKGTGLITESVFESRFGHLAEMKKMGAQVKIDGRCAVIEGGTLSGAKVNASDLRAGAALVIAGLCASGETTVNNAELILRGYEDFDIQLKNLGANCCVSLKKEKSEVSDFS